MGQHAAGGLTADDLEVGVVKANVAIDIDLRLHIKPQDLTRGAPETSPKAVCAREDDPSMIRGGASHRINDAVEVFVFRLGEFFAAEVLLRRYQGFTHELCGHGFEC